MAALDTGKLTSFAAQAGWSDDKDIKTAVAIAKAESGGDPSKHNTNAATGDDSYGLMQINMKGSLGPDRRKKYGIKKDSDLLDPAYNMRIAYKIWADNGNSFNPWTTYKNGAYKKFANDPSVTTGISDAVSGAVPDVGNALSAVGQTLFKGVAGLTGIIVAVVLMVLGVVILLRNQLPTGKALKAVKNLAGGDK